MVYIQKDLTPEDIAQALLGCWILKLTEYLTMYNIKFSFLEGNVQYQLEEKKNLHQMKLHHSYQNTINERHVSKNNYTLICMSHLLIGQ